MGYLRDKVENILAAQGRSISWLAKEMNIKSRQTVYDWLDEVHAPRNDEVWDRMAEIIGVEKEELLDPTVKLPALKYDLPSTHRGVHLAAVLLDVIADPHSPETNKEVARYTILQMLREK